MRRKGDLLPLDVIEYANHSIGRTLRARRVAAGLSQREVARRARIQPAVLCRLERGSGNPTVATIEKVMKAIR